MSNKSGIAPEVISLPRSGGAIKGIAEAFQANAQTGTGNHSVPLNVPVARNDSQPQLALTYSTGAPNGPFGLGWALGVPGVTRKTSRGVPRYEGTDAFLLGGAEELVLVDEDAGRFRPRTEQGFADIRHVTTAGRDEWRVVSKSGNASVYGAGPESRLFEAGGSGPPRIFAWLLSETRDPNGNRIVYTYRREDGAGLAGRPFEQGHSYNQLYLSRIEYGNYPVQGGERFMFSVELDYGEHDEFGVPSGTWAYRPDPFSTYRPGFEVRTVRRCRRILVKIREEGGPPVLVRSYLLRYLDELAEPERAGEPLAVNGVSLLTSIEVAGHRPVDGVERTKAFVPVTFRYSTFEPERRRYRSFSAPRGELPDRALGTPDYELVDLHGDGLPDVIHTSAAGYRYWRNCGGCRLDAPRSMGSAPAGLTLADPGVQLADVEGVGAAALLVTRGPVTGYYPLSPDASWDRRSFRRYAQAPSFDLEDPEVRLADVDGDGVVDALMAGPTGLTVFHNEGRDGWGGVQRIRDELPAVSFAHPSAAVRLASMTGEGLQDLVLVRSRHVRYAPNLGHGRFAPFVTMRNAPVLPADHDPRRVFLADVDGDGYADLVYIGADSVSIWINQSGNAWSEPRVVRGTPAMAGADAVRVADMNGTGMSGVLWTYDRGAVRGANLKYLDLTGSRKPYLMNAIDSGLGARTTVSYAPSTEFLLRDLASGRPWRTRLPFPVHVVQRVEVADGVSKGRLVSEYAYHDGSWDGEEREFCGFGCVDQRDAETFEAGAEPRHFSPPRLTRTWFHLGHDVDHWGPEVPVEAQRRLPDGLSAAERRQALRSLRGSVLRIEVYGRDGTAREDRPYTVMQARHRVELVARSAGASTGAIVAFPHPHEAVSTELERGDEPRRNRVVTLYDEVGNRVKEIRIGEPRDPGGSEALLVLVTDTAYASAGQVGAYLEDRVATVVSFLPASDDRARIHSYVEAPRWDAEPDWAAIRPDRGEVVACSRNYYDGPAYTGLELGKVSRGNLARSDALALTPRVLQDAYREPPAGEHPERPELLADLAALHYATDAAGRWITTSRLRYDEDYGLLVGSLDPNGNETLFGYDEPYRLHITEVEQAATGLVTRAEYDYLAGAPRKLTDANGNVTELGFDELGMVVAKAERGKGEGDELAAPTVSVEYDLRAFADRGEPVFAHTRRRREHKGAAVHETREYFDGFARSIQVKTRAAPSADGRPRWITSGGQRYNNKGWVVERHHPFFSPTAAYEAYAAAGSATVTEYDPIGRPVRIVNPDGTFRTFIYGALINPARPDEVEPTPWEAYHYDENDNGARTCGAGGEEAPRSPEEIAALGISSHLATPAREIYDAWNRRVELHGDNGSGTTQITRYAFDALGRITASRDAKGHTLDQVYDLTGRPLRVESPDLGARLTVLDASGNTVERADAKGARTLITYDALNRPVIVRARDGPSQPVTVRERHVYDVATGTARSEAATRNTLGRVVRIYDDAGRLDFESYDARGNVLRKVRRPLQDEFAEPGWPEADDDAQRDDRLRAGEELVLETTFDALDRISSFTCPDGSVQRRSYDEGGLLCSVSVDSKTLVADIAYTAVGGRSRVTFGNGVETEYAYDERTLRLRRLVTRRRAAGAVLQDLAYEYDPVGNPIRIGDAAATRMENNRPYIRNPRDYAYDPLYRLTRARGTERRLIDNHRSPVAPFVSTVDATDHQPYERHYDYDALGNVVAERSVLAANRWTVTFAHQPGTNRLSSTQHGARQPVPYQFDACGNLKAMMTNWHFDWDHGDRLRAAQNQPQSAAPTMEARYRYDAKGACVVKVVRHGNLERRTVYVDGVFEVETESMGGTLRQRTQIRHVADAAGRFAILTDVLEGANHEADPPVLYQHPDHVSSAVLATLRNGGFHSQEEFYPYGDTSFGGYARKRYRFAAMERSEETGLYAIGDRHYAPWLARWISCDPEPEERFPNPYAYCRSSPVRFVDPTGRNSFPTRWIETTIDHIEPRNPPKGSTQKAGSPTAPENLQFMLRDDNTELKGNSAEGNRLRFAAQSLEDALKNGELSKAAQNMLARSFAETVELARLWDQASRGGKNSYKTSQRNFWDLIRAGTDPDAKIVGQALDLAGIRQLPGSTRFGIDPVATGLAKVAVAPDPRDSILTTPAQSAQGPTTLSTPNPGERGITVEGKPVHQQGRTTLTQPINENGPTTLTHPVHENPPGGTTVYSSPTVPWSADEILKAVDKAAEAARWGPLILFGAGLIAIGFGLAILSGPVWAF
jgi:RHS repeat-associated protein